ncbi:DUF488 domain-containing protein [Dactylosporangium cerinum]
MVDHDPPGSVPVVRILTVGHGARSIGALLEILVEAGVGTLVDVRRSPGSRRHPQFGRDALADAVTGAGLRYTWRGETLGGRREARRDSRHALPGHPALAGYADHMDTAAFRGAVDDLITPTATEPPAILCAETLWWQCHRMLIADALVLRGAVVEHLVEAGVRQPHRRTDGVRAGADGWPVYDAQQALPGL